MLLITGFTACNRYAIGEYLSIVDRQDYSCECVAADGTKFEPKSYTNKTRKAAEHYCADTEDEYRKNKLDITCSLYRITAKVEK